MPKHVLLVDDAPVVRKLIRTTLCREGYRVTEAGDAEAALRALATETPDLLISDIMMPDVDGFELLSRIRSNPRLLGLPVIFVTAAASPSVAERASDVGVEHFIEKPIKIRQLLATVRGTLERFTQLGRAGVVRPPAAVPSGRDVEPSGIGPLDDLTGGLQRGHVYYINGDVGAGKTAACLQFVHHALTREQGAVLVTTDRPSVLVQQSKALGLDLEPFLERDALVLLELAGDPDRLVEGADDLRALADELAANAAAVKATRLAVNSVLVLLATSPRLGLSTTVVNGFLRKLEDSGVTTLLLGDAAATPEEQQADAFIRRAAFGSIRLARTPGRDDARFLVIERMRGPHSGEARKSYCVAPGRGLVTFDPDAVEPIDSAGVRTLLGRTLDDAGAGEAMLIDDATTGVRLRDAWALAVRDCVAEVLRTQQQCALLIAKLKSETAVPARDLAESIAPLCGSNRVARMIGSDLVVFGIGEDVEGMEAVAEGVRARVNDIARTREDPGLALMTAVASFSPDLPSETLLESLRRLSPKPSVPEGRG